MTIKGILFDLDDTLIPSEEIYAQGLRSAYRQMKAYKPISWPQFAKLYLRARSDVKRNLPHSPSQRNRTLYFKRLVELVFGYQRPAITLALMQAYETCWKAIEGHELRMQAAVLSRRYKLGIITNQVALMQLQKMNRIDPQGIYFKVLVTSEEVGVEKPDILIYKKACQQLGCLPQETLVVGNSWHADVLGALKAGLKAALWAPAPLRKRIPKHVKCVRHLTELTEWLMHE